MSSGDGGIERKREREREKLEQAACPAQSPIKDSISPP